MPYKDANISRFRIIAEEMTAAMEKMPELTDAPTWFLDPIDGTTNFIHSFPNVCISLALTIRKELVLGIIYNPLNSELYSAIKGQGAFLNGKPIRTSNVTGNVHLYSNKSNINNIIYFRRR
jgi:fructose-1,6-bisphosphatase/inositol monophosphatase family enzyme